MSNPLVTVIIPTYNRAKYIEDTIRSVINQTYKNLEIIVYDDGSTDNTKEIVESFKDKRIKYFWQKNSGMPAVPRNKAINHSSGEYIAFIDSDDLWLPNKLEKQLKEYEQNNNVGLVCTSIIQFNENDEWIKNLELSDKDFTFKSLLFNSHVRLSSVLVKKSVLNDVGLFDENPIIRVGEDYELWLRISKKYKIKYIDLPLTRYRHHIGNISKKNFELINALKAVYSVLFNKKIINRKIYELMIERMNYREMFIKFIKNEKYIDLKTILEAKISFLDKYILAIAYFMLQKDAIRTLQLIYYKKFVKKKLIIKYEKIKYDVKKL